MAVSPGYTSTLFEGRRPSPISAPPSGGEIKKLRERLLKYGKDSDAGLTDEACAFLAAAVTSPGAVRQQLNRPTIRPTATGYLEVIRATVPIDCLAPDPTNGRVVGATTWPASDAEQGQTLKLWAPADMRAHPRSAAEVLITSDSLLTVKRIMEDAAESTKKLNEKMREKVQYDGILDPLLCQFAHIETEDGVRGIALITRDGSTRCSYAKEAHGAPPHDVFFGPVRDVEVRRQRWLDMRRLQEQPLESVSEMDLVGLRTFFVDVEIVVAYHSEDPTVTALDAVDDIVRRTHVEVTHPWSPVAQRNSEADQMLAGLRARDEIGQNEFLLYGGTLSRAQRTDLQLPIEPDCVVAELMKALGASETRRTVQDELHMKMRAVFGRGRITSKYKATIAGALGLRQFDVDPRSLETAHLTLGEALGLESLWDCEWENSERSPEALRTAALEELRAGSLPGPACRELVVKAAGHMAAEGWLKRETRVAGGVRDQSRPDAVLDNMHRNERGVYALAEALTAGRRSETARAVQEDGEVVERAAGDAHPMTNQWIRSTFADSGESETAIPTTAQISALSPRERVDAQMLQVESAVDNLERQLGAAAGISDDDGHPFLQFRGWTKGQVQPLVHRLQTAALTLNNYGVVADISPGLPPVRGQDHDAVEEV